jgi:hypothetical protein
VGSNVGSVYPPDGDSSQHQQKNATHSDEDPPDNRTAYDSERVTNRVTDGGGNQEYQLQAAHLSS